MFNFTDAWVNPNKIHNEIALAVVWMRMPPPGECLVYSWWNLFERIRRCGLIGGGITVGRLWGSQSSHQSQIVLFASCSWIEMWAFIYCYRACLLSCSLLWESQTLTLCNSELHIKCFLVYIALVMMFCHSNRTGTKTCTYPYKHTSSCIHTQKKTK